MRSNQGVIIDNFKLVKAFGESQLVLKRSSIWIKRIEKKYMQSYRRNYQKV